MTAKQKHAKRYWGQKPLPKTKVEFFDAITTPAPTGDGTVATIRMYGPIDSWGGYWGISTKDVGEVIDALPDTVAQIILRINSPGGEVFEGVSILNMLRAHKASIVAVVDGLAASAASVIAAGCDEVVMSPGTQMMIHSPSTIAWGNAAEMRKTADVLDSVEASLIEVYTEKAGEKDWAQLLADETWLTAAQAVELGLADRVAVIPDAGETETLGEDEEVITIPDDDEPEDLAASRVVRIAARASSPRAQLPSSSEPGEPNRKETVVDHDAFVAGIRERLGMTDANASDETVLAALDEALTEQPDPQPTATLPEGAVVMDAAALEELRANAALGAQARQEQERARRDSVVDRAVQEGRISPASRDQWRASLDRDEQGITDLLETFPANTIPVAEIGHADQVNSADDALYAAAWGHTEEA